MRVLARLAALLVSALAAAASADARAEEAATDAACPGLVASRALPGRFAGLGSTGERGPLASRVASAKDDVGITFVGHATFLIESPTGVRAATDYNDFVRPAATPDVATMNKAHSTHFTYFPDPAIKHVLRGWGADGAAARHDLRVGDVRVRNIPTNIRDWSGGTEFDANSIFVFETADLCIAHLGHLHHTLEQGHLKKLGRIDVLLVPVDGGYTLDVDGMMQVLEAINAPLMLPMHYFGPATLNRFLARARERYEVAFSDAARITVSRATLPKSPKMLVLPGR